MTVCCSFVGDPCGKHGPYTFYKAFRYRKDDGASRIVSLGGFFLLQVGCNNKNVCIGELQLLWHDRNNNSALSSSRLYFLPENTPQGRAQNHGQDEVMAMSEKVVLRLDDLVGWMAQDVPWNTGCPASVGDYQQHNNDDDCDEDDDDQQEGADQNGGAHEHQNGAEEDEDDASGVDVVVVSYPRYCRYRAILKRLEGAKTKRKWLRSALLAALGGTNTVRLPTVRILFCRDTFHFDALEKHELLCNHLAPNLKGRPRKKRSKDGGSESNESTESREPTCFKAKGPLLNGCRKDVAGEDLDEQRFLQSLFKYMRQRNTPIERVPHLGFKQINLYVFFTCTQKMGGYEKVTAKKLWKQIYDELGGNPGSTSAATCTRRHYERLLLAYERNLKGEEDKPLPAAPSRPHKPSNAGTSPVTVSSQATTVSSSAGKTSSVDGDVSVAVTATEDEDFSLSPDSSGPRTGSIDEEALEGDAEDEDEDAGDKRVDGVASGQRGSYLARTLKPKDDTKQRQWEEFRRKSIAERESARQSVTRATKENHPKPTLVVPPLEVAPALLQLHQVAFKAHGLPSSEPAVAKRMKVEEPEVPRPMPLQQSAQPAADSSSKPKSGSDVAASARPSVIRHTHSALLGQPSPWCHVAPPRPRTPTRATAKIEATCPVRTVAPFHQSPFTFGWSLARERAPLATRDANCRDHRHHGHQFHQERREEVDDDDDEQRVEEEEDDDEDDGQQVDEEEEEEDCSFVALDLRVKKPQDTVVPNAITWSSGSESPKELDLSVKRPAVEILPVPKCPKSSPPPSCRDHGALPPPPHPPPVYGQYLEPTGKVPRFPEYGALLAPPPYYALPVPRSFLGLAGYVPDRPNAGAPAGALRDSFPYPGQFYPPYCKDGLPYGCPPEWRP